MLSIDAGASFDLEVLDAGIAVEKERYLTVGFAELPSGLNAQAIGTQVSVAFIGSGSEVYRSTQVVDGGSGHGSQGAGRLVFGLGGADTASIEVFWPNGRSQSFSDASALAGFPAVTLDYPMDPEIDEESVTVTYTPSQGSTTHKWTWWVEHAPGNPQVLLSLMEPTTTECKSILGGGTQLLLEQGVPGVSVQVIPMDGGFECRVYYNVYCNAPCNYSYSVRNDFSGVVYGAGGFTHTVSVCGGIGM